MILASRREDDAPGVTVDPKLPLFDSCFEVNGRGQNGRGGRKDSRIESRNEEDAGEWWRHRKNNEHKG